MSGRFFRMTVYEICASDYVVQAENVEEAKAKLGSGDPVRVDGGPEFVQLHDARPILCREISAEEFIQQGGEVEDDN